MTITPCSSGSLLSSSSSYVAAHYESNPGSLLHNPCDANEMSSAEQYVENQMTADERVAHICAIMNERMSLSHVAYNVGAQLREAFEDLCQTSFSASEDVITPVKKVSMKEQLPEELQKVLRQANFNISMKINEFQNNIILSLWDVGHSIRPLGYAFLMESESLAEGLLPFVEEITAQDLRFLPKRIESLSWLLSKKTISQDLFFKEIDNIHRKYIRKPVFFSPRVERFYMDLHRNFHEYAVKYISSPLTLLHLSENTFGKMLSVYRKGIFISPATKISDLDFESITNYGHVAFMNTLIEKGELEAVKELHRLGASISHQKNPRAETPLKEAVKFGQHHIVEYLLRQGACEDLADLINLHRDTQALYSSSGSFLGFFSLTNGTPEMYTKVLEVLNAYAQEKFKTTLVEDEEIA